VIPKRGEWKWKRRQTYCPKCGERLMRFAGVSLNKTETCSPYCYAHKESNHAR